MPISYALRANADCVVTGTASAAFAPGAASCARAAVAAPHTNIARTIQQK
jgi:hypothetical protein